MAGNAGAFTDLYLEALQSLSVDRSQINFLRDLAEDNKNDVNLVVNLVAAVQKFLKECPKEKHLAVLYLIDCILKTVKDPNPYPYVFGVNLPALFAFVWDGASQSIRPKLVKLAKTWKDTVGLPQNTIQLIDNKINGRTPPPPSPPPENVQAHLPAAPPAAALPVPLAPVLHRPNVSHVVHAPSHAIQPALFQSQPVGSMHPPFAGVSMQAQQHVAHPPATNLPAGPSSWGAPDVPPASMHGHAGSAQPQASWQQASFPSNKSKATEQPTRSASQIMQHMMGLGSLLGVARASPIPASGVGEVTSGAQPTARSTEFSQSTIKEFNQDAVDILFNASNETRGKFLDLKFVRNRRLKAATTGQLSRHWYLQIDSWLQGSTVEPEAEHKHFEEEIEGQIVEEEVPPVEEDPSQPACVICGELFERSYDPVTDKWYYEDAIVLEGEEAEKYGVMDGTIVKKHAIAGAPSITRLASQGLGTSAAATAATLRGEPEIEGEEIMKDMREAAAQANAESASRAENVNGDAAHSGQKRPLPEPVGVGADEGPSPDKKLRDDLFEQQGDHEGDEGGGGEREEEAVEVKREEEEEEEGQDEDQSAKRLKV